jgi:hypothetical protein
MHDHRTLRGAALRRFLRHLGEMIIAMVAGMTLLGPLESALLHPLGWAELTARTEAGVLIMVTNMTIAMVAWMRYRRHGWPATGQMAAAMYVPFVALFPLMWLGLLAATGLMVAAHVLMLPAMIAAMVWRMPEYTGHTHSPSSTHPPVSSVVGIGKRNEGTNSAAAPAAAPLR